MKTASLPFCVLCVALGAACDRPAPAPASRTPAGKRVESATAATVTGRVLFSGTVPRNPSIVMSSDAFCVHANPGQPSQETVIVGPEGGLQYVFVYVKDDLAAFTFDTPAQPVRLEQKGCRFVPHVIGLQAGQTLEIVNRDDTLHNVHAITKVNDDFNVGATQGSVVRRTFARPETMITFKCDVHAWMTAYAGVVSHPYFAVTDAGGRFQLKGLPPGAYTVAAWHEKFGEHVQQVRLGPNEPKEIAFTFSGT